MDSSKSVHSSRNSVPPPPREVEIADPGSVESIQNLSNVISEWKRMADEVYSFREQIKEKKKRMKVMEEIILRTMKAHHIGALDLKNSGGRILYKKQKQQTGMGSKNLQKYLMDCLGEQDTSKVLKYIQEHKQTTVKELLQYEKN